LCGGLLVLSNMSIVLSSVHTIHNWEQIANTSSYM
jgi:hypothetical protein